MAETNKTTTQKAPAAKSAAAKPAAKPAAAKAPVSKPAAVKPVAKPVTKTATAKPAAKPTAAKPAAKPTAAKPAAAKATAKAATGKTVTKLIKATKAGKPSNEKETRPHAVSKHVRMSSTKVRIVMDLVRGKSYNEAVAILTNTPNASAEAILKTLKSAGANGENNMAINKDDMYVAEIYATQGPSMKRLNIRARGRVDRITKRTCHVYVVLDTKEN